MSVFYERFLERMQEINTVDCHSHTLLRREYYAMERNLFSMRSYFNREIQAVFGSSGLEYDSIYGGKTDEECWKMLKKAIAVAGNTSYWRHNLIVYRKFFDLADDELTDFNWRKVNKTIQKKTKDPHWYRWITEDVCRLRTQIRNVPWYEDWEPEYFTCILRMEPALDLLNNETRETFQQAIDRPLGTLRELKTALVDYISLYNEKGNRGIKLAHAYQRTLLSEQVPEREASTIYENAIRGQESSPGDVKRFQDHIIFFLGEIAGEMNLVFQIHTGVQTTWGWIPDSDPVHLLPLIHHYRDVKFDLFHMGFPYSRELGMIGKHYPNVYLNMAWAYLISMEASRNVLSEWIDLVPGTRLLGFGSDVQFPEMIYGHLIMARSCLADVLESKVQKDYLSTTAAGELLNRIMADNAVELYRLI